MQYVDCVHAVLWMTRGVARPRPAAAAQSRASEHSNVRGRSDLDRGQCSSWFLAWPFRALDKSADVGQSHAAVYGRAGASRADNVVAEDSRSQHRHPGRRQDHTQQHSSAVLRRFHLACSGISFY